MSDYILLIEDNAIERKLIKKRLLNLHKGLHIEEASNGEIALNFLKEKYEQSGKFPNVITLDINMPVMNGLELLKSLEASPFRDKLNIIVVTSSENNEDMSFCENFDFVTAYFVKPIKKDNADKILNSLKEHLINEN